METNARWHLPRLIIGVGIVLIGLLFLLNNLELLDAHQYLRLWPVLLMLVGVAYLVRPGNASGRVWGAVLLFFGTGLLLDHLEYIHFRIWDFWPVILVIAGGSIVLQAFRFRNRAAAAVDASDDSTITGTAIMSGFKRASNAQDFRGGQLTAVMGGIELDLRRASIKSGEVVLDIFTMWGGVEMRIPEDWTLVNRMTPFMGGVEDATTPPPSDTGKRLVLTGTAIMGGVEVRN